MTNVSITFDGNDLSLSPGVQIYDQEFNDLPRRDIKINKIARRDLSIITSAEYVDKEAFVYGIVRDCERYNAEAGLVQLRALLQKPNSELKLDQANRQVRYTATMSQFSHRWLGNNIVFTITFLCSDPIGSETTTTSLLNTTITTSVASINVNVGGSFTIEPTINLTIGSVTGGTNGHITVSNSTLGQGITLNADFVDGDIISIDSFNKIATINGSRVDYTGLFPTFAAGSQVLGYVDDFTTRSVDITGAYRRRFV